MEGPITYHLEERQMLALWGALSWARGYIEAQRALPPHVEQQYAFIEGLLERSGSAPLAARREP